MSNNRDSTRWTLPSMTGTDSPWQMLAMAAAVYSPMPGSDCQSAAATGITPPRSSMIDWAAAWRLRARL